LCVWNNATQKLEGNSRFLLHAFQGLLACIKNFIKFRLASAADFFVEFNIILDCNANVSFQWNRFAHSLRSQCHSNVRTHILFFSHDNACICRNAYFKFCFIFIHAFFSYIRDLYMVHIWRNVENFSSPDYLCQNAFIFLSLVCVLSILIMQVYQFIFSFCCRSFLWKHNLPRTHSWKRRNLF
jgi:hypothetical protein